MNGPGASGFHLYFGEDNANTLVALLPPAVAGPSEHTTIGAITRIEPHLVSPSTHSQGPGESLPAAVLIEAPRARGSVIAAAGVISGIAAVIFVSAATTLWIGLSLGAALPVLGGWLAVHRRLKFEARWAEGHRVLSDRDGRNTFRQASSAALHTLRQWSVVSAAVRLDDPSPTLARSLWEIAGMLVELGALRDARVKLTAATRALSPAAPVHPDIASKTEQVDAAIDRLETDLTQRLNQLISLADEISVFVRQRQAVAEARAVLRDADRIMGGLSARGPRLEDDAAELAEHTASVLIAYRELTSQLSE